MPNSASPTGGASAGLPQNLAISWTFSQGLGLQPDNPPLLVAGDRLVGFYDGQVYGLTVYTKKPQAPSLLFQSDAPSANPNSNASPPIAGGNGAIFVPGLDQNQNPVLQALRLVDGAPLPGWQSPAIGNVKSLTAVDDLVVIVQPDQNGIPSASAVRMADGSPAWGPITVSQLSAGSVGYGDGAIFFASGGQLCAVNTKFPDIRLPPAPAPGASSSGASSSGTSSSGTAPSGTAPTSYAINELAAPLVAVSPEPRPAGSATVICTGQQVWAFDGRSGALLWALPATAGTFNANVPGALSDDGKQVALVSDAGNLYLLNVADGSKVWDPQPVGYKGTPVFAGDVVFVCGSGQSTVASFDRETGTPASYALPADVSPVPPAIGNGHIYVQSTDGSIRAFPYGDQSAAYFDGATGQLKVDPEGPQGDAFDLADFTIEAWVRSSSGGEIVCGYPTAATGGAGFRFNLSPQGRLRFAVTDPDGTNQDLAQSAPTAAADGLWHHVAGTRSSGNVSFYVDGIGANVATRVKRNSTPVHANGYALAPVSTPQGTQYRRQRQLLSQPPAPKLAVEGQNALFIGWDQHGASENGGTPAHFTGLIREVRLWDKALDGATVQNRMNKVLGPRGVAAGTDASKNAKEPHQLANEPHLLGNWHLDDTYDTDQQVTVENDVLGNEFRAHFSGAASMVTDLDLDMSAFPYLLDEQQPQWPYKGSWCARGEHDISLAPALSKAGVICFGTDNYLYGVRRLDGGRVWSLPTPEGHSTPIAHGASFYVNTGEKGLLAIDAASGASAEMHAFKDLATKTGHLSAPATNGRLIAAAAQDGTVYVIDPAKPNASVASFPTATMPGDVQFEGNLVACIAGPSGGRSLYVGDLKGTSSQSFPVDSEAFALCGTRVFFTSGGSLIGIDIARQPADPGYRAATAAVGGPQISGLAGSVNANLLAVTTNYGAIYGLSLATLATRWQTALPDAGSSGAKASLQAPTISGAHVFCTGAVPAPDPSTGSSPSGALAALDLATGRLIGLFLETNAVVTPAIVHAGTAFFGCAPGAPTGALDGALHSVVFGEAVVLRVGVDAFGKRTKTGGYAAIDPKPLSVGENGECCVEAFVTAQATADASGGEILSIPPTKDGNVGLRLFLGADGVIHFLFHYKPTAGDWKGFLTYTQNPTNIRDGGWHHIAVSRKPGQDPRIYVDGQRQALADIKDADGHTLVHITDDTPTADDLSAPGGIRIGAPAYRAIANASTCFHGMIADVRVWDTYISAHQISARMHTKLRGDEANLVAYWNFRAAGVHDDGMNGFDGALATETGLDSATFWLCDLTFDKPKYADMVATAKLSHLAVAGSTSLTADAGSTSLTTYELTLTCTKADGTPLDGAQLTLWYVKHPNAQQPATLQLTSGASSAAVQAKLPHEESLTDKSGFAVTTAEGGKAVITVGTSDRDHGPSLDVAADFMPKHERFHVNVLNNVQKLAEATPPSLIVQTKLIQDYHYETGGTIDHTRSRNTYRTVITAVDADHSPRVGELLEIFALDPTTIEVAGQSYSIGPQNSQSFRTDANGQLTVVIEAASEQTPDSTGLKTPDLAVWAGFMHQNERVTVALDQDTHQSLSNVQGAALTAPRLQNWQKPAAQGTDGSAQGTDSSAQGTGGSAQGTDKPAPGYGSLLDESKYDKHKDAIAGAIRHVASSTQPPPPVSASKKPAPSDASSTQPAPSTTLAAQPAPAGAAASPAAPGAASDPLPAMRQPPSPVYGDRGQALRTHRDVLRRATVTPESVLASIQATPGNADAVGFHLTFDGEKGSLGSTGYFTAADAADHMGTPSTQPTIAGPGMALGSIFSDAWDDVESAAEQAADEAIKAANDAIKIAVEISDTVTVAIHYVDEVVHVVVSSIADAMEVIANFIEKLALLVWQFIQFLLFLFDWEAIIETHAILKQMLFNCADHILDGGQIGANAKAAVSTILNSVPGLSDLSGVKDAASLFAGAADAQVSPQQRLSAAPPPQGYSDASGVSGTMVSSKIRQYAPSASASDVGDAAAEQVGQADQIEQLIDTLATTVPELVTASPADIGTKLLDIFSHAGKDIEATLHTGLDDVLKDLDLTIRAESLDTPFYIPFISQLYKWITGDDLTLVDACCLALAVPTNIVYGAVTFVRHGQAGHFNKDAKNLPHFVAHLTSPALASPDSSDGQGQSTSPITAIPWDETVELFFLAARVLQIGIETGIDFTYVPREVDQGNDIFKYLAKLFGAASAVVWVLSFAPRLNEWMVDNNWDEDTVKLVQEIRYAGLSIKGLVYFFDFILATIRPTWEETQDTAKKNAFKVRKDNTEYKAKAITGVLNGLSAYADVAEGVTLMVRGHGDPTAAKPLASFWCYQLASVCDSVVDVMDYVYTYAHASTPSGAAQISSASRWRLGGRTATAALQTVAVVLEI